MNSIIKKIVTTSFLAIFIASAGLTLADNNSQIIVDAGPTFYVASGQSVVLQGSGYDITGSNINYAWSCPEGQLSSYSAQQPTFTPPQAFGAMSYVCTLTVNNSYGLSNSDITTIYVNWGNGGSNSGNLNIQTYAATNVNNNQATLQGYLNIVNYNSSTSVFFQWGPTVNYGNQTASQSMNSSGPFSQTINDLSYGTTYHYRAVAQSNNGTIYGPDATFSVGSYNYYYQNQFQNPGQNNYVSISKKVINLTSGNLNWQTSVNAKLNDVLSFAITIQPGNQDIHNVYVRDILPVGLSYQDSLTVNASQNYSGNILSGINIGTVYASQPVIIAYQARVVNAPYGVSTLTNSATVTSNEGVNQTSSASIVVNNYQVAGATSVSTGVTNNPIEDSFLLPVLLIILFSYLYFSGKIYTFADWLGTRI